MINITISITFFIFQEKKIMAYPFDGNKWGFILLLSSFTEVFMLKRKLLVMFLGLCSVSSLLGYVVVHHHHNSRFHILPAQQRSPSWGETLGTACANVVNACLQISAEKQQFNNFVTMFENLGYDEAQAKIYAKMAMKDPGGFSGVVQHIENQRAMHQQIENQKQLMRLKHQQDKELLAYKKRLLDSEKHKLLGKNHTQTSMLICVIFIFCLISIIIGLCVFIYFKFKK